MNVFEGKISSIKTNGSISLIGLDINDVIINTVVIETPDTAAYLAKDHFVKVMFKETEVVIGKGIHHAMSIQNKIVGNILDIEKGELLSKLTVNSDIGDIVAIITTDSMLKLELKVRDQVTAMIKTTEIMLSK